MNTSDSVNDLISYISLRRKRLAQERFLKPNKTGRTTICCRASQPRYLISIVSLLVVTTACGNWPHLSIAISLTNSDNQLPEINSYLQY